MNLKIKKRIVSVALIIALALFVVSPIKAGFIEKGEILKKVDTTTIMPESFLRRWDPITVFFDTEVGSEETKEEDDFSKFVSITPKHSGVWQWINKSTLQFRPVEPWPVLSSFKIRAGESYRTLQTLMSPPVSTIPSNNSENLDAVNSIILKFADPVDAKTLAESISIELRKLPAVDNKDVIFIDKNSYKIKVMESNLDLFEYKIDLQEPIPLGMQASLNLRLSPKDTIEETFHRLRFATIKPFTIKSVGCKSISYPLTSNGSNYPKENPLNCGYANSELELVFSDRLADINPIDARNFISIEPAVNDLSIKASGSRIMVGGKFAPSTLYKLEVRPTPIKDEKNRLLVMDKPSSAYFYFNPANDFLSFNDGHGIIERYGPKMIPLKGRGHSRIDLRIHAIDPLNFNFWPFPDYTLSTDDAVRPSGPGEEEKDWNPDDGIIYSGEIAKHISQLGTPALSKIVELPIKNSVATARFGLDLEPYLEEINNNKTKAGTYLVGLRILGESSKREWARLQVTDLSLTTVEEEDKVRFLVTSLSTGEPVEGATIRLEGINTTHNSDSHGRYQRDSNWQTFLEAKTDALGTYMWNASGYDRNNTKEMERIVVQKKEDTLVFYSSKTPEQYKNNLWSNDNQPWLQWAFENVENRRPTESRKCHIFTERPVYRPEEPVHIKMYSRIVDRGNIKYGIEKTKLYITGPDNTGWTANPELTKEGSAYYLFDEKDLPTGEYSAEFFVKNTSCGKVNFKKEAYVVPKLELEMNGPVKTGMDKPFSVGLVARYYAGGNAANQDVEWRVTGFPYNWIPESREGFVFSTDARFSNLGDFDSKANAVKKTQTDESGSSSMSINPSEETIARPMRYIFEATITGADNQSVSNTYETLVLPPFAIGIKAPRYLEKAEKISPEITVLDYSNKELVGQEIKVNLYKRQWTSILQAGNFSLGTGRYITDTIDEKISTQTYVSSDKLKQISFPINEAGVYIIEAESTDKAGRRISVKTDLFAGGNEAVTWSHSPEKVFKITSVKKDWSPLENATIILESPFMEAKALIAIERPDGQNQYDFINIHNGVASYTFPIEKNFMPSIPVHVLLIRKRLENKDKVSPSSPDFGKPTTLASTIIVNVNTDQHKVNAKVTAPSEATPSQEVDVEIMLEDEKGNALSGEVTLWLVDQAVLALGKEQRLDPLPDFIVDRGVQTAFHDTRNLAYGLLPFVEDAGGGEGGKEKSDLLDNVTIRKNFKPVPYFNPAIMVDETGKKTVKVKLPDNLTNFKIRAKVVSSSDRFGYATGQISVRLPVIVQPALPRFIRFGDKFTATAIGRIILGNDGQGIASIKTQGLDLSGESSKTFDWQKDKPEKIEYQLSAPLKSDNGTVSITMGIERKADKAKDAFAVELPLYPDRMPEKRRIMGELSKEEALKIPAIKEAIRKGSFTRSLMLSTEPALLKMAAGLSYLDEYPHGCTEQKISKARTFIAASKFREKLNLGKDTFSDKQAVKEALQTISENITPSGLVAYWSGEPRGLVTLTAWAVQFMVEARKANYNVDDVLYNRMVTALKSAVRSDYSYFVSGSSYEERTWAIAALLYANESLNENYLAELSRKTEYLNMSSLARVAYSFAQTKDSTESIMDRLYENLKKGIVLNLYNGNEVYAGLQEDNIASQLILPSEARTISQVLRAMSKDAKDKKYKQILVDALVNLADERGWGTTNANAEAFMALSEFLNNPSKKNESIIKITENNKSRDIKLDKDNALTNLNLEDSGEISLLAGNKNDKETIVARIETSWTAGELGSKAKASSNGFVINREAILIKENSPNETMLLDKPNKEIKLSIGDIVEEHIEFVNPKEQYHVAVVVPLAAGLEPLNPELATSSSNAKTLNNDSVTASYAMKLDDRFAYYFNLLPKGTHHLYFRTKATVKGQFSQPQATIEMMYDDAVNARSNGAMVVITDSKKE